MGILKEFRDFAMRGNILELGTAVIIGGAFGKIVDSLVNDILMPPLGVLIGNMDFKDLKVRLVEAKPALIENGIEVAAAQADVYLKYGMFIQNIIDFTIIAFAIFMMVKLYNNTQKAQAARQAAAPAPPAPTPEDIKLLTEIRDLLKK
jgi:large conductance mechanosensitive channel